MNSGRGECRAVINALTEKKRARGGSMGKPLCWWGGVLREGEAPGRVQGLAGSAADAPSWAWTRVLSSWSTERPAWQGREKVGSWGVGLMSGLVLCVEKRAGVRSSRRKSCSDLHFQ